MTVFKRAFVWALVACCLAGIAGEVQAAKKEVTELKNEKIEKGLTEQIATDLVAAGISITAALSGNVALALTSGLLTKYITTYGIAGVKKVINYFKGNSPRDLGEINLYYLYMINIKRNLYYTLINIRKSVEQEDRHSRLSGQLIELSQNLVGACEEDGCTVEGIDETMVNFHFVHLAMDMEQTLDMSQFLQKYEIKATYQYMMLLYLDLVLMEQKLIEAQYDVLANTALATAEQLEENEYISNEEKEFQYQLVMNMALRWTLKRDQRRALLTTVLKAPLENLSRENRDLDEELRRYEEEHGKSLELFSRETEQLDWAL